MNRNFPELLRIAPPDPRCDTGRDFPERVLDALADTVIVVDNAGHVRYLNHAGAQLLGHCSERAQGRPLNACLRLKDGRHGHILPAPLAHLLARDTRQTGEYDLLLHPDGREIPIESATRLLDGDAGKTAGVVIKLHDATDTYATFRLLSERATHDDLTRLVNRGEFERRLAQRMVHLCAGETHALLYMDLDGFKSVNDTAGHAAGDAALRLVANTFQATVRERDTLARLGGDEFALLLEHCPAELALQHAHELQAALADTDFRWKGHRFQLGVSIGLAMISGQNRRSVHDILMEADLACYAAKRRAIDPRSRRVPRLHAERRR